jgi:DNA-directed RNA polymerase subunit M/transcription elongation factor TFIIS
VHARSHSSLPIFQCGYCDYSTFDYGRRVRKHIASKHPGWPVQVVDRSQEFARQLQAIKTTCFPLLFGGAQTVTPSGHERCQVCLKDVRCTYRTNHVLLYHLKLDMFKCSTCAYSSQHLKAAVKQHIERKHRGQHAHVISSIDSCRDVFDDMKEQCFPSLGTGKKRGRPVASVCDSPTDDPVQETRVKRKYVRRNSMEQQPSPQPHQTCRLCGQPGIATKSEHVRVVHMSDTPFFMCPHCDFTRNDFASKLQVHIDKVHHSDAAPIDCSDSHQDQIRKLLFQCFPDTRRGRRPLRVGAQQRPLALRPSKSKTDHFTADGRLALGFVRCRVCDVTLRKTYRMPHMLINHLGREDAYKCSECDFSGNYKRTIEKHAVGVHGSTAFALVNVSVGELDEMRIRCFGRPKSTNRSPTHGTIEKPVSPEQKILPERRTIRLTFANALPEREEQQQHSAATDYTERKSKRKQSKPQPARFRRVSRNESIESDSKEDKCAEMNASSTSEEAKECALCAKRVGRANRLTHVLATHLKVKCMFECTRCSYMHDSSAFVVINHMRHKHGITDEHPLSHTDDFQSEIADWTSRCFTH